jgi:flavin-dependent dehydrogenase
MKKRVYDVIIVGAGLGGLKLAELLNNSKLKVLLIEKRNTIKKLVGHIYGTYWETIKKWKLQKYIIRKCGWGFYTTENKEFRPLKKRPRSLAKKT